MTSRSERTSLFFCLSISITLTLKYFPTILSLSLVNSFESCETGTKPTIPLTSTETPELDTFLAKTAKSVLFLYASSISFHALSETASLKESSVEPSLISGTSTIAVTLSPTLSLLIYSLASAYALSVTTPSALPLISSIKDFESFCKTVAFILFPVDRFLIEELCFFKRSAIVRPPFVFSVVLPALLAKLCLFFDVVKIHFLPFFFLFYQST